MRCRPSRQVAYTTASQVSNRLSPTPPHFAASFGAWQVQQGPGSLVACCCHCSLEALSVAHSWHVALQ